MLSICELGNMSNEKTRLSDSKLGAVLPLIHTLLYRWANPRTTTKRSSSIEMPGTRFTTSEASRSSVLAICCDEIPLATCT